MWVLPAAAGAISGLFAVFVFIQWLRRRRPHQVAWAAALAMFAVASGSAAIGLVQGWSAAWFRSYYLFGAIINVPFLALGTIYLLGPRWLGHVFAVACVGAAVFAAGSMFTTELNSAALVVDAIPSGEEVLGPSLPRTLSRYYSYIGFGIVVGGALWSAWQLARKKSDELRPLVTANVLIAVGTTIVAIAGGLARFGQGAPFAVALLIGVTVMFIGFLNTWRRPRARPDLIATEPVTNSQAPVTVNREEGPAAGSAGSNE